MTTMSGLGLETSSEAALVGVTITFKKVVECLTPLKIGLHIAVLLKSI